jgi:hypothetical protein
MCLLPFQVPKRRRRPDLWRSAHRSPCIRPSSAPKLSRRELLAEWEMVIAMRTIIPVLLPWWYLTMTRGGRWCSPSSDEQFQQRKTVLGMGESHTGFSDGPSTSRTHPRGPGRRRSGDDQRSYFRRTLATGFHLTSMVWLRVWGQEEERKGWGTSGTRFYNWEGLRAPWGGWIDDPVKSNTNSHKNLI